jgi:hypothetical protein
VTIRQAFPAADAEAMLAATWDYFGRKGIRRDDRSTWPATAVHPKHLRNHPAFDRIGSPRLRGAVDDLVGAGRWSLPSRHWGLFRMNWPEAGSQPWELNHCGWHWDSPPSQSHLAVFAIIHIGETVAGGGGTLLVSGSPRLFADHYARWRGTSGKAGKVVHCRDLIRDHPWFERLASPGDPAARIAEFMHRSTIDADGHELRVVEATGMPGDVTLCHPTIYHSVNVNRARVPRIMRFCMLNLKSAWPAPGTPRAASEVPLS